MHCGDSLPGKEMVDAMGFLCLKVVISKYSPPLQNEPIVIGLSLTAQWLWMGKLIIFANEGQRASKDGI